jgi:hypothetical protein
MSTRLKQRAVIEFLSAENMMPTEIHRRLQAVYGENTVNRTTVNRWAIVGFSAIRPTALTWLQAISISFLTSRGISSGLISPQKTK